MIGYNTTILIVSFRNSANATNKSAMQVWESKNQQIFPTFPKQRGVSDSIKKQRMAKEYLLRLLWGQAIAQSAYMTVHQTHRLISGVLEAIKRKCLLWRSRPSVRDLVSATNTLVGLARNSVQKTFTRKLVFIASFVKIGPKTVTLCLRGINETLTHNSHSSRSIYKKFGIEYFHVIPS